MGTDGLRTLHNVCAFEKRGRLNAEIFYEFTLDLLKLLVMEGAEIYFILITWSLNEQDFRRGLRNKCHSVRLNLKEMFFCNGVSSVSHFLISR